MSTNAKRTADLASAFAAFLDRREEPRALVGKPDAQAAELASLLRTVDAVAPPEGWLDWYPRFEAILSRSQRTRVWPTDAEIEAAGRAASQQMAQATLDSGKAGDPSAEPSYIYGMVRDWWLQHRSAGPGSVPKEHHAELLVEQGHATYGALWRKNFPIPRQHVAAARAEREPQQETL